MEKMAMKMLVIFVLGMNHWTCTGFPVYDYDPASLKEALSASVAKVNSQSLSPYLFRAFRSSVKRVNALDEDSLTMDLEFRIQETTCRRESEADPATCDFQRGYHVPVAVCRSTVRMSAEQVQNVWVRCHWSSSSGSSSSEEMFFGDILGSSTSRNSYLLGLTPDRSRGEPLYEPSREMRRNFPLGNRRYSNPWPRARVNPGFE
ncbi:secreted phosphoprotein 24 precursor [Bos taurus]|uniref:Secreted phosphoprotein 24 n=3 Tax=Bos TaxID=9903 RepID=SPP24_BOVIN|nr:secreted phosphoprotein 24 precursor [Bos taurus]Q27967.2 RecName: Full=Secreted phosphoprotein 24; Short=Spp-24; AltName: Full=Secreted phosphoprotein 2; Flags: Precursor [Bos taurus]AAI03008.1 SPP2 protein [Bos taurus]